MVPGSLIFQACALTPCVRRRRAARCSALPLHRSSLSSNRVGPDVCEPPPKRFLRLDHKGAVDPTSTTRADPGSQPACKACSAMNCLWDSQQRADALLTRFGSFAVLHSCSSAVGGCHSVSSAISHRRTALQWRTEPIFRTGQCAGLWRLGFAPWRRRAPRTSSTVVADPSTISVMAATAPSRGLPKAASMDTLILFVNVTRRPVGE